MPHRLVCAGIPPCLHTRHQNCCVPLYRHSQRCEPSKSADVNLGTTDTFRVASLGSMHDEAEEIYGSINAEQRTCTAVEVSERAYGQPAAKIFPRVAHRLCRHSQSVEAERHAPILSECLYSGMPPYNPLSACMPLDRMASRDKQRIMSGSMLALNARNAPRQNDLICGCGAGQITKHGEREAAKINLDASDRKIDCEWKKAVCRHSGIPPHSHSASMPPYRHTLRCAVECMRL